MDSEKVIKILKGHNAILNGHFQLSSGLHSDTYFQCAKLFENPSTAERMCKKLASLWKDSKIDIVCGPAYGGIILSYVIARQLGARAIFFERVNGKFQPRRGFSVREGEAVLVAEDVVTTGGSVGEIIQLLGSMKAKIVGVTSIINRGLTDKTGSELRSLATLKVTNYKPEDCPMCKKELELIRPGSR